MLEDMKLKDVMHLVQLLKGENSDKCFWEKGKSYFIRTVTMHLVGNLHDLTNKELLLKNAVWVADSGRFYDALKTGELSEVEPFITDVILNRESIVDASEWKHAIPQEQK